MRPDHIILYNINFDSDSQRHRVSGVYSILTLTSPYYSIILHLSAPFRVHWIPSFLQVRKSLMFLLKDRQTGAREHERSLSSKIYSWEDTV